MKDDKQLRNKKDLMEEQKLRTEADAFFANREDSNLPEVGAKEWEATVEMLKDFAKSEAVKSYYSHSIQGTNSKSAEVKSMPQLLKEYLQATPKEQVHKEWKEVEMEFSASQFQYDFSKTCKCKHSTGSTWCCNQCGLPEDNESKKIKSEARERIQELESNKGVDLTDVKICIRAIIQNRITGDPKSDNGVNEAIEGILELFEKHLTTSPQPTVDVPSDDEIDNHFAEVTGGMDYRGFSDMVNGAKWMRDKLKAIRPSETVSSEAWISVKDEMPDKNNRHIPVLLFNGDAPLYNQHVFQGSWSGKDGYFGNLSTKNHLGTITHWMPLPNPPKQLTTKQ